MDYKYIGQLIERYWQGETSLEEEQILRAFFSQREVPASLERYRALFMYEQAQPKRDVLGGDFDERMLSMIGERQAVKARRITWGQRLAPLFKAAAVVAIVLTLSQAAQMSFRESGYESVRRYEAPSEGSPVALSDTLKSDTIQCGMADIKNGAEAETYE